MDEKSNFIPVTDGFEYPSPIPIFVVDNFFNKKQKYFSTEDQCCMTISTKEMMGSDDYGDGEERDRGCEMGKEKRENLEK